MPFQAADIRFTTKGPVLYAMTMGKPAGEVVVKSLAGVGAVQRVEIVGTAGALAFRQEADGLHVTIPDGGSHDYGVALKISGDRLT